MNNLLSYCGLVDVRISASEKDLPVASTFSLNLVNLAGFKNHSRININLLSNLHQFENLSNSNNSNGAELSELPTAYDYVRLGHPLSCVLEWIVAKQRHLAPENVISFSSKTIPVLSILRKNLFEKKKTQILYSGELPGQFGY